MDKFVSALNQVSQPDKLGIICATLIIVFSFFSKSIDSILTFLFGSFLLLMFIAQSFNRESHTQIQSDEKTKLTQTKETMMFSNYPPLSIALFWISGVLSFLFFIRLISVIFF